MKVLSLKDGLAAGAAYFALGGIVLLSKFALGTQSAALWHIIPLIVVLLVMLLLHTSQNVKIFAIVDRKRSKQFVQGWYIGIFTASALFLFPFMLLNRLEAFFFLLLLYVLLHPIMIIIEFISGLFGIE